LEIVKKPITLSKLVQIIQQYLNWLSILIKTTGITIMRGTSN
jgi:hypothetical protein